MSTMDRDYTKRDKNGNLTILSKTYCDYCGNEIASAKYRQYTGGNFDIIKETIPLPFKCKRCNGLFCADHRLPEMHDCIGLFDKPKNNMSNKLKRETLEHQGDSDQSKPAEKLLTPEEKMKIAKNMMARAKFAVEGFESNTKVEYINTRFNEYNYREDEGTCSTNETSMELSMWCKIGLHKYGKPQVDSSKSTSLKRSYFKICKRCGKHVSWMESIK